MADWETESKCKICNTEMDLIYENCDRSCRGCDVNYWCPRCGAMVSFYDSYEPDDYDWHIPETVKLLISGEDATKIGQESKP